MLRSTVLKGLLRLLLILGGLVMPIISIGTLAFAPTLSRNGTETGRMLGDQIEILQDAPSQLTLADARDPSLESRWQRQNTRVLNLGFSDREFWGRIALQAPLGQPGTYFLTFDYPLLDQLDFYQPDSEGVYFKESAGDALPFAQRPIHFKNPTFAVHLDDRQPQYVYWHFASRDTLILPLKLNTPEQFAAIQRQAHLITGAYLGAMAAILAYTLLAAGSARQTIYLWFALVIAAFTTAQISLDGTAYAIAWGDHPEFAKRIRPLALGILSLGALFMTLRFFERRKLVPGWPWLVPALVGLSLAAVVGSLVLPFTWAIQLSMVANLVSVGFMLSTGFAEMRSGYIPAYYFMGGFALLILGGVANVLRAFSLLPVNFFTLYGAQLGSVLTLLLISSGLSERVQMQQKRRELIQNAALDAQQDLNRVLDQRVRERTRDLEESTRVVVRKNQIFKGLLELGSKFDHRQRLPALLELSLNKLRDIFPSHRFALLLDSYAAGDNLEPMQLGLEPNNEGPLKRYHWHLMQMKPSSPGEDVDRFLMEQLNVVPIRGKQDRLLGHLMVMGRQLSNDDIESLLVFIEHIRASLQNKFLHDRLDELANHDPLTGVYSRTFFDRYLHDLTDLKNQDADRDFTLILVDINGLKQVNDRFGHDYGDRLISIVAQFLQDHCRGDDIVARLGGDEFVIVSATSPNRLERLLRVLEEGQQSLSLSCLDEQGKSHVWPVRFSFGYASSVDFPPREVLRQADQQMYSFKRAYYQHQVAE